MSEELLPQDAPMSEKYDQFSAWLLSMGYEMRHAAGYVDDTDWDVSFVPAGRRLGEHCPQWTYHSDTRQGLLTTLERYVQPWLRGGGA